MRKTKELFIMTYLGENGLEYSKAYVCMGAFKNGICRKSPHIYEGDELHLLDKPDILPLSVCPECLDLMGIKIKKEEYKQLELPIFDIIEKKEIVEC
jgi:hypothetical protein